MHKKVIVDDLIAISLFQGEHNGYWSDEYSRDESSKKYLEKMKGFADKYDVSYSDDLEDFRECENEEDYILRDRLGFFIFESLKEMLIRKL